MRLIKKILLCSLLLSCAFPLTAQTSSDFQEIRQRAISLLLKGGFQERDVSLWLNFQEEKGSWPDIDYVDTSRTGFDHARHLDRLKSLALAYRKEHSTFHGRKDLKEAILAGLDFWFAHDFTCENWWWNQIGVPNSMLDIMLIMDGSLPGEVLEASQVAIGRGSIHAWGARPGGDRIKIATIDARTALLLRDEARFARMNEIIEGEIKFVTGRGLQWDYSFHHRIDRVNNTLSYGLDYARYFASWAVLVSHSSYRFKQEAIQVLIDYYLDGICKQMVFGRSPDPGIKNRSISRQGALKPMSAATPIHLMQISDYRSDELEAVVRARQGGDPYRPSFATFFRHSEHFAFQCPDYYASVRMFSTRNANMEEPYNGEGLLNHHRGDGSNHLSLDGQEYAGIWPVYDWQKIPGTTVLQKEALPPPEDIQHFGKSDFTGAVSNGTLGAAAFDFISPHDPLEARKAWFFFEGSYLCLGSGIRSHSDRSTVTTLNQCLLRGAVTHPVNGRLTTLPMGEHPLPGTSWVHHDRVAYVPLGKEPLYLRNREESGSWWRITHQASTPRDQVHDKVFCLYLDHGAKVRDGSYSYRVVPAIDAAEVEAFLEEHPLEVLSNTPGLQAAWDPESGLLQAVFYGPGKLQIREGLRIFCDSPAMLLLRLKDEGFQEIWVSDPTRKLDRLHLGWERDQELEKRSVLLPTDVYAGMSVSVSLKKNED